MPNTLGITDGTAQACWSCLDDFSGGNPGLDTSHFFILVNVGSTTNITATIVSLDSDGFTINIGNRTSSPVVNYLCLGGSDITGAKVITGAMPTTAINQAYTGAGFAPDGLFLLGGPAIDHTGSGLSGQGGIGAASSTTHRWATSSSYSGGAGLNRYQRINLAMVLADSSGGNLVSADLASLDSDGFTLSNSTSPSAGRTVAALCLKGCKMFAGSFTQPTSTGSQSVTGVGFQPGALLYASCGKTAGTTEEAGTLLAMHYGGTDGTNQACVGFSDNANGNATMSRTKFLVALQDTSTPVAATAGITSLDADGFTVNWTTADATTRELLFFAIGPSGVTGVQGTPFQPHRMPLGV